MKVPAKRTVYVGAKVFKEGQECPFLKEQPKKEKKEKSKND